MTSAALESDGVSMLAQLHYEYVQDINRAYLTCKLHEKTAAVHDRGESLQIYSLFERNAETAETIRTSASLLGGWEESPFYKADGKKWEQGASQIERRMAKHSKQQPIITRGVDFEDYPILVHAYKFEPDPVMKVELVIPEYQCEAQPLSINIVAAALRCMDFLVPSYIAAPLAPYAHHEARFTTILEYLKKTMPQNAIASLCLS